MAANTCIPKSLPVQIICIERDQHYDFNLIFLVKTLKKLSV
jgi:hypothetical protein